jgi:uncharacterized protein YceK
MKYLLKYWPGILGILLLIVLLSVGGCAGVNKYTAATQASRAFLQACSNPTIEFQVIKQGNTNTLTITCSYE